MKNDDYWINFWKEQTKEVENINKHEQVLRTSNGEPISEKLWKLTLSELSSAINTKPSDDILDLCSGNGLISKYISEQVNSVIAVDVSENLLKSIDTRKYLNIKTIISDIRILEFENNKFNTIFIYAGIQYLTECETLKLFEKIYKWLKPGGILFLGDIPDRNKLWNFYNTEERKSFYFSDLKVNKNYIGTWFNRDFFENLSSYIGFKKAYLIEQHADLLNSASRYDYKFIK
jgi:ubiquinone/menaquinone biosynthesis C-methylase UbiE